jgi:hypothetical protein
MKILDKVKSIITKSYNNIKEKKQYSLEKQKTLNIFHEILESSYFDEESNTIVINTPTNIIFKSQGDQVFIAENGMKVDIANAIHLNPIVSKYKNINTKKDTRKVNEVLETTVKIIK